MLHAYPTHSRATGKGKSFYQTKFLFILWAIFFSVLVSFLTPSQKGDTPYTPVFSMTAVKGATTVQEKDAAVGKIAFYKQEVVERKVLPSPTPQSEADRPVNETSKEERAWGKSRQIGEYTWTIDVADDERAGTAEEIFQALNDYRKKKGKGTLSWSGKLAEYARSRADTFAAKEGTDSHAGFKDYLNNQDGFTKLGFMRIGENSSYGYKVLGVHLIEWVYAGDAPHDNNQLSDDWTHVGVGVNGTATDLIFAGNPM